MFSELSPWDAFYFPCISVIFHLYTEHETHLIQECQDALATSYLSHTDELAWPPVKISKFIDLVLIEDKKTWRNTIDGAMDDIINTQTHNIIYPSNLFSILDDALKDKSRLGFSDYKLYLLQGRPGCGKTTLVNMLITEWANGKLLQSRLLFFVTLRRFSTQKNRNLTTIIQQASPVLAKHDQSELASCIEKCNGKNAVFVFDGLDEYSIEQNHEEDVIFRLIRSELLPNALVIITSRPAACNDFRQIATRELEVIGFLQEQIKEYIQCQFNDKAHRLLDHLEHHPSLMNMCYLPLHCAMFAFLFDGQNILPPTETEFYKYYTISTLLRSIRRRQNEVITLSTFDQLPPDDKKLFDKVCEVAYNGAVNSKVVFTRAEIFSSVFGGDSTRTGNDESTLGLIVIDRFFMRCGLDETYTFLHRTHQEYLAAVHVAQQSSELQYDMIKRHVHNKDLATVWKFLCGMLDYSNFHAMNVFLTLTKTSNSLFKILCAYESHHSQPCNHILCSLQRGKCIVFTATETNFRPSDFIALDDVITIANSGNEHEIEICFEQCNLSDTGAIALLEHIGAHPFNLELSK